MGASTAGVDHMTTGQVRLSWDWSCRQGLEWAGSAVWVMLFMSNDAEAAPCGIIVTNLQ